MTEPAQNLAREGRQIRTSIYRGVPMTYAVEGGSAVYEGDILLGAASELPEAASGSDKSKREAATISSSYYRWPNGAIPYTISSSLPNPERVISAIDHWNTSMPGHVQFVGRTTETSYVDFVRAVSLSTCASYVGRIGGRQTVEVGDYCSYGSVVHEIGHSVGLWHEQSREDRDKYVKVLWENIQPDKASNFLQNILDGDDIGAYDYGSIMHYPALGFSSNGKPTIETIPVGIAIGQRKGLSAGDIAAVMKLYPLSSVVPEMTTRVTIISTPTGMPVVVDGETTATPVSMDWVPGSVHTINALDADAASGSRNTFVRWSDSSIASRTIIVPAGATTYSAAYVTSHSLSASAWPVGSVTAAPATNDTFYTSGTAVSLTATAPAGYCFASWTGLLAGTPSSTNVMMTRSYAVQANFVLGTLTVPASAMTSAEGGMLKINVAGNSGCAWASSSTANWITVVAGGSGLGAGVITLAVAANTEANARSANISIAGQTVTIEQTAATEPRISFPSDDAALAKEVLARLLGRTPRAAEVRAFVESSRARGRASAIAEVFASPDFSASSRFIAA
jgi:hypothetical protein